MILWDDIFGRQNNRNIQLRQLLTDNDSCIDSDIFCDLNILFRLFPNIEQIEYFKQNQSRKQIKRFIHNITETVNNLNCNLKYLIIHHQYSMVSDNSSFVPTSSKSTSQPLLLDFGNNNGNIWTITEYRNKVIIHRSNDSDTQNLKYHFNDIRQGYTSMNILQNFR